jgi:hypothetical protein
MKCIAQVIVVATTTCACGYSSQFTALEPPPHPVAPRSARSVEASSLPNCTITGTCVRVGVVEVLQQSYNTDSLDEVFLALREEAGAHGCDGLMDLTPTFAIGSWGAAHRRSLRLLLGYRGTCVVYRHTAVLLSPPLASPASSAEWSAKVISFLRAGAAESADGGTDANP